ncbi:hypothetical protein [Nonomuraea sp. NPDC049709]|uniref:hypothetical protein n=1 Tax=Nonomuraea sp. NPDC049709 TaxID=3154736 RepID=UPI003423417C
MQAAGSRLYAYDSRTARVGASSAGRKTWIRGTEEDTPALAASAAEPDRIDAAILGGLRVSTDVFYPAAP